MTPRPDLDHLRKLLNAYREYDTARHEMWRRTYAYDLADEVPAMLDYIEGLERELASWEDLEKEQDVPYYLDSDGVWKLGRGKRD